ncbi:MAG: hypothetical protein U0234_33295 [Sandaracinus sp.]
MRNTTIFFTLLAATALSGCPGNNTARDGGGGGTDTNVPREDTGIPPEDTGTGGTDSGTPATDVPLASVVNASAADHPADGTTIHITGDLVALSRTYVDPQTSGRCLGFAWIGTLAGGDHSGIEIVEQYDPDTGSTCFDTPPHVIPNLHIGDAITNLVGRFANFCPSGSACPPNTAQELIVTTGTVTAGTSAGDPVATDVTVAEIAATGISPAPRDMALQNALVHLTDVVIGPTENNADAPNGTNHNIMGVVQTGSTTPIMRIEMSAYPGVSCQRTQLTTAGQTVGDITGLLHFSFGEWRIQPRVGEDLPGITCTDAGTGGVDAGM